MTLHLEQGVTGQVEVLDLFGHIRQVLASGTLNSGDHEYPMSSLSNGMYIVRILSTQGSLAQKFAIVSP